MKPALRPMIVEMMVTPTPTRPPRISELRIENTRSQKMSCPSELVPRMWSHVIGRFLK